MGWELRDVRRIEVEGNNRNIAMSRSQGIVQDEKGQQQPADKDRAQPAHKADPKNSREATRDPKLNDPEKTPGSRMVPNDRGDAPTG